MIISATEAYSKSKDGEVIFVDCRFDLQDSSKGRGLFEQEHLPNSIYFDLEEDLSGPVGERGGRHPLPNLESFTNKLAASGITPDSTLIVYDNNYAFASRFYWLMKLIRHKTIYLINGGFNAWKEAGYPTTDEQPVNSAKGHYGPFEVNREIIAVQEEVFKSINEKGVAIIDSRSYERFSGQFEPIDHKAGHIPTAKNYDWQNLFEKGYFKSTKELMNYFKDLAGANQIIVYCGSGVTAAPNVLALWQCGFSNVKLYVGSFSDWISNDQNEVSTL
ncbi:sulfurtransferase [Alkalibacillus aidingensis]|uniref:sulfurtransferase n=1 Tax=Alkalibacillus aidingensis TaxID=2747607 RepID=UPI0016612D6D|nr:sulfurtransferase [Alkalibacillus aidingensis]